MTISQVQRKSTVSFMKIKNFSFQKRSVIVHMLYAFGMMVSAVLLATLEPLERISTWIMEMREGSLILRLLEDPPYIVHTKIYLFNYTNLPEYLNGEHSKLRLEEIGPFVYEEKRTNRNMSFVDGGKTLRFHPHVNLTFLPEHSVADPRTVNITVPNIALIAISSIAAEKFGYLGNSGAYYSIKATGSNLFNRLTAQEYMWGYDDPLVTIANTILPGWIDFDKMGIVDRFYSLTSKVAEIEVRDQPDKFSIKTWDDSPGIIERQFTDLNSSTKCNRIKGTFEGMLLPSNMALNEELPLYRKQACRVFPFEFQRQDNKTWGFTYNRYVMKRNAFSRLSDYACECNENCLPDGFVDISNCYYNFPITVSKPHYMDADPGERDMYEGMKPDREKHTSYLEVEPTMGVPLALTSNIQVNLAVKYSMGNPITYPIKDRILPVIWISLKCESPSPAMASLLKLRFKYGPPLLMTLEVLLIISGAVIAIHALYEVCRHNYLLVIDDDGRKSSVIRCDDAGELARQSAVLLEIPEVSSDGHEDDNASQYTK